MNLFIALLDMLLELWINSDRSPFLGLAFDDGQLIFVEDLRPTQ